MNGVTTVVLKSASIVAITKGLLAVIVVGVWTLVRYWRTMLNILNAWETF